MDVVIIGAGPAGLSAGIYASRAGLNFVIIESAAAGGQVLSTYEVDNYPALPGVTGMELGEKMRDHALKLGARIENAVVKEILENGDTYIVKTSDGDYETKAVIVATGASHAKLGVDREEELTGLGVSYCATCDGAFYKGADVAVVGGGDVAAEDAIFLARSCNKVYLIHRRDTLRASDYLQKQLSSLDNVEIVYSSVVEALRGEDELEGLAIRNVKDSSLSDIDVDGLFVAVGINPVTQLVNSLVATDEKGYIIASEDCRTSMKRVYAIGDARKKPLRQIVTAVADGANSIESIISDIR